MNIYQILELILETLADGRQEGESITDYKKRKADELEKHFTNKEEEAKTKARAYRHQYKKEKKEWKNNPQIGAEKALDTADKALNNMIKSSDARRKKWEVQGIKKKMNKNEALEIMEEIINEVSLKKWKEAAKNSIEGREKEAAKSLEATDKGWQEYEKEARKHPEDEPQLFKLAQVNDAAAYKDKERAEHAAKVAYNAPDSKHSANKFLKAARNAEEFHMDKADYRKPAHKDEHYKKAMYARHQASMDPVKSRTSEALEIMEEILNVLDENIYNAIDDYVKDPEKKEKLSDKDHDIQQADDPDQKRFLEKNVHKISGHGKEYQKHNGPYTADYPNTGVYVGMDSNKTVDHLMKIAKSKAEDRYWKRRAKNRKFEKKMNAKEALELMEQICDFADNLFELDYEEKQNISPNKVSRVKKGKNGEKVEVVSVADELFPYEGDAKQQFNQKVLAKINDMIEGTGSLEDLIQFVRKGVAAKKNANEGLDEEKNIFGKETGRGDLLNDIDTTLGSPVKKKLADIKAKMTGCKETKVHEALDLMEEIINELNDEVKVKTGIKRLENARNAYQDFKDSGKNLDNAKKEWQQARDKYSALRAEKKMKVGDSLRAEGEFRDKYFQANRDFYQKYDDAQAANNKLKRFSKVQNIKDPKAASDLKQEVDKFKEETSK